MNVPDKTSCLQRLSLVINKHEHVCLCLFPLGHFLRSKFSSSLVILLINLLLLSLTCPGAEQDLPGHAAESGRADFPCLQRGGDGGAAARQR